MSESDDEFDPRYLDAPFFDVDGLVGADFVGEDTISEGMRFHSLEDALSVLQRYAAANSFTITKYSNKKTSGVVLRQIVRCSRSGNYRPSAGSAESKRPKVSRKTDCPFRINLRYRRVSGDYFITKAFLSHNHACTSDSSHDTALNKDSAAVIEVPYVDPALENNARLTRICAAASQFCTMASTSEFGSRVAEVLIQQVLRELQEKIEAQTLLESWQEPDTTQVIDSNMAAVPSPVEVGSKRLRDEELPHNIGPVVSKVRCSKCRQEGHNKATCGIVQTRLREAALFREVEAHLVAQQQHQMEHQQHVDLSLGPFQHLQPPHAQVVDALGLPVLHHPFSPGE